MTSLTRTLKVVHSPGGLEPGWAHFRHGADIGVRGFGHTLSQAFAHAAVALTAVVTDLASVQPRTRVIIRCHAPDVETLLVDWLNALVLEMATRTMLFSRFDVHVTPTRLDAVAWGEEVEVARHQPAVEIKGATFTQLQVSRGADGLWSAQCVVDV